MPDVGVQVPPNLADWWPELVEAGATDLGGLSGNGDHISPEEPFPSPHQVRKGLAPRGYALTERLCVYPQYLDPEWMEQGVLDVVKLKYWSFIPRRGSGRRQESAADAGAGARARSRRAGAGEELSEDELTALFAETRPEVIEEMRVGRRRAARRAGRRDGDLRRQPQHQLHQRLRGRLRVLRLRPGQALARRLPRRRGRLRRPGRRRRSTSARPRSACRAASIPTTRSRTTGAGCGWPRRSRPQHPPARLLADGGPLHVRALGPPPGGGLRVPDRVRPRLDARDRGRGARRRRAAADLAEQAAGRPLGRDHRGLAPRRACARPRR